MVPSGNSRSKQQTAYIMANDAISKLGVPVGTFALLPQLRAEILAAYPSAKLNPAPAIFDEEGLIDFLVDCDAAIIGLEPVSERVLAELPQLRVIGKFGVGVETIDFEAMRRHGVRFGYQYGINRLSVAELTIGFAIAALRGLSSVNAAMRAGTRPRANVGRLLTGRVFGIHGCGHIGKEVVRLLKPFNCEIIACDIADNNAFYRDNGVQPVSFETLLERSEVLSLHIPLTRKTRGLYAGPVLDVLRSDCVLINTSRGGIVDETALCERLESGRMQAACFDVFAIEPATDDRLLHIPSFLATPHIGASAIEARLAMARSAIAGLTQNEVVDPAQFAWAKED
ncbi:MAG: phosphoglycerate dehydrogenase [Proteobacteria bacterium]|nr:phosphoglycerate dehydrogenase [Pseudomonadota bacterium]